MAFFLPLISDFTLGFSDGLTVPFALTAGLSSLGDSRMVIYAGLAELCAGSISMGIGGFLAARDEARARKAEEVTEEVAEGEEDEEKWMLRGDSGSWNGEGGDDDEKEAERVVKRYLMPLGLSETQMAEMMANMPLAKTAFNITNQQAPPSPSLPPPPATPPSAVLSGLSISTGYLTGGLIPLLPYFFTSNLKTALTLSVIFCSIALFTYGSVKSYFLNTSTTTTLTTRRRRTQILRALAEGLHMLIMGGLAATVAVIAVVAVDRLNS